MLLTESAKKRIYRECGNKSDADRLIRQLSTISSEEIGDSYFKIAIPQRAPKEFIPLEGSVTTNISHYITFEKKIVHMGEDCYEVWK